MVLSALQKDVLTQPHSGLLAVVTRALTRHMTSYAKRYFWVNMYRDAINTVSNCLLCQARRMQNLRVPMQDMTIPEHPF